MSADRDKTLAAFGEKQAASYDDRFAKASAMRDAMHLVTRLALSEPRDGILGDGARVLCVGAGTGLEIGYLAAAFPRWRFTAVEPAPAMLALCRKRADAEGFTDRCEFHEGFLESLPESEPYDAATCLLVSHFLQRAERRDFFAEIARRLKPDATLVNADLASGVGTPEHTRLMAVWRQMWLLCDTPVEQVDQMLTEFEKRVPLLPPSEVVEFICSAGFEAPTPILQTLLIHGWSFVRSA